jgi:hypothetical protein
MTTRAKKTAPKKDRHATPVIVTASGQVIATRKRITKFLAEHSDTKVLISEIHHYAMLRFLHVAKDDEGRLHLATLSAADEEGWTIVSGKEA